MGDSDERIMIIEKLTNYKLYLEKNRPKLVDELYNHYHQEKDDDIILRNDDPSLMSDDPSLMSDDLFLRIDKPSGGEGSKKVDHIRYDNPYEVYLNAQIRTGDALIPILEEHITFLEDYEDLDLVLESFEHAVYHVKKQTYTDVEDWEQLIDHLPEDRLKEIKNNPKGHGDLLIKELIWIRNYEDKWMKK